MSETNRSFDLVLDELKMYRNLDHGSYSHLFMDTYTYNTVTGKKTIHFKLIQVTGWKFIYQILNYKYKRIDSNICLIEKRIKKYSQSYPIQVYYDYMKAHLDYLSQLSLPPLPQDYNNFKAYYNSNSYSKWFPEYKYSPTQQLDNVVKNMKRSQMEKYYKEVIEMISGQLERKKVIQFSSDNLSEIYRYLV